MPPFPRSNNPINPKTLKSNQQGSGRLAGGPLRQAIHIKT